MLWRLRSSGSRASAADLLQGLNELSGNGEVRIGPGNLWVLTRFLTPGKDGKPETPSPVFSEGSSRVLRSVFGTVSRVEADEAEDDVGESSAAWPLSSYRQELLAYYAATQRTDPRGRISQLADRHGTAWHLVSFVGDWWHSSRLTFPIILHGLGRVVTAPDRLARVVDLLTTHWSVGNVQAALASLLARPVATPDILDVERTGRIACITVDLLDALRKAKSFGTNLKYALHLVAGLLRCRTHRPLALLRATSPDAARLHATLSAIRGQLAAKPAGYSQRSAKLAIVDDLLSLLDGTGGRASILVAIEDLADDDGPVAT
ncbi:hypothetical protein [Oryzibacter oryziterrae]|uniref:hypothetical protein n=1 Tax=Oryzibacter oryziterrae TaxID=2766474 RepID=UPI001F25362A|nr:hypothetical protein [Oryzibacter oryziterrae]